MIRGEESEQPDRLDRIFKLSPIDRSSEPRPGSGRAGGEGEWLSHLGQGLPGRQTSCCHGGGFVKQLDLSRTRYQSDYLGTKVPR